MARRINAGANTEAMQASNADQETNMTTSDNAVELTKVKDHKT